MNLKEVDIVFVASNSMNLKEVDIVFVASNSMYLKEVDIVFVASNSSNTLSCNNTLSSNNAVSRFYYLDNAMHYYIATSIIISRQSSLFTMTSYIALKSSGKPWQLSHTV